MVPAGVEGLSNAGHTVLVQKGAGLGSGIPDAEYVKAGAKIIGSAPEIFKRSDMIVKVKEPIAPEFKLLRENQTLFTYLHLAADRKLTQAMMDRKIIGIAYETIEENGSLPLLTPMSEIAGRMAIQEGAKYLERPMMGRGVLLAGVPGVAPCKVVIIGGGVVGTNAAKMAAGLGSQVTLLDVNLDRLRYLDDVLPKNVVLLMSNSVNIREQIKDADLLIGGILLKGAKAPVLVSKAMLKTMKQGAVLVDVSVDQGGCIETTRPTTHQNPTYIVNGVVHYCVANMPGAVGRTSTFALTNATFPYVMKIVKSGAVEAIKQYRSMATGVNVFRGHLTYQAVAETFNLPYTPIDHLVN